MVINSLNQNSFYLSRISVSGFPVVPLGKEM